MSGEDAFKDAGDVREDSNRASLDSHAISARDPQHPDSSSLATASSAPQLQESIAVSKYMAFLADHADKCMSFAEQVDRDPKHALLQELVGMVAAALNYLQVLGPNTLYPEQSIRILDDIERSLERAIRILQEQVAFPTTAETIAKLLPMVANLRDNYPHVKDLFSRYGSLGSFRSIPLTGGNNPNLWILLQISKQVGKTTRGVGTAGRVAKTVSRLSQHIF